AGSAQDACAKLAAFRQGEKPSGVVHGRVVGDAPLTAFLFTGQGCQFAGMGRELYETQPRFRRTLERCDEILRSVLPVPLLDVLYNDVASASFLDQTAYTQPALFALEY